jgi:hypothetical protein
VHNRSVGTGGISFNLQSTQKHVHVLFLSFFSVDSVL